MEATINTEGKLPSWRGQQNRRELFTRMSILEQAFARCDKLYSTQEWLRLQDELGIVYREVMEEYGG